MKDSVEVILAVFASNAGGFVIMAVLVIAFGWALWSTIKARIADLDRRLVECDRQHAECEARNRQLARAVVELSTGRGEEAGARAKVILDE